LSGALVIVAGPSGVGKSTLLNRLLDEHSNFVFAVSCTTRSPRRGELHGREYYFIQQDEFNSLVNADEFIEWENLHAQSYGTLKSEIQRLRDSGKDVVLDIDVSGALNVRRIIPEAYLVFVMPPSVEELARRLRCRNTDSEEQIAIRLSRCRQEIDQASLFDCQVVNDELEESYQSLLDCLDDYIENDKK
jgi:guanylate kinase